MAQHIRDIMTSKPTTMPSTATVAAAAHTMRDKNIGDVLVMDGDHLCGIATDRDLVVRVLAADKDPQKTRLGDVCSDKLTTVSPDAGIEDVVKLMKNRAVRRVPVVEDGQPVGIVSLGDLAIERDRRSALGEISAAKPNR